MHELTCRRRELRICKVATNAASPVLLPGLARKMRTIAHWVRAPGYAWERLDVDPGAGGTRTVELGPGGSLVVDVLGARPDRHLLLL